MTTAAPPWQELFRDQRHALLGQLAGPARHIEVRSLADEETVLVGGASEASRLSSRPKTGVGAAPRAVVLTPQSPVQTLEAFHASVAEMRSAFPEAELSGFGPLAASLEHRFQGLDRAVVLAGRLGRSFEPASDLAAMPSYKAPLTAVLVYAPELTAQALEQAVEALGKVQRLVSVVPLPAGAGDRIPLPGLTTGGTTDVMAISALRILLPAETRVRASWAALGWKVAQVALAYGADEIAGWTAAETLAYTGRVRAASRVERQELNEGLEEARCRDAGWSTIPYGETL